METVQQKHLVPVYKYSFPRFRNLVAYCTLSELPSFRVGLYLCTVMYFVLYNSSALLGPSLDKFEKIRIKVGLVLVAICDKTEYTN